MRRISIANILLFTMLASGMATAYGAVNTVRAGFFPDDNTDGKRLEHDAMYIEFEMNDGPLPQKPGNIKLLMTPGMLSSVIPSDDYKKITLVPGKLHALKGCRYLQKDSEIFSQKEGFGKTGTQPIVIQCDEGQGRFLFLYDKQKRALGELKEAAAGSEHASRKTNLTWVMNHEDIVPVPDLSEMQQPLKAMEEKLASLYCQTGVLSIEGLDGSYRYGSEATGVSADGRTVVGTAILDANHTGSSGFIWTQDGGLTSLAPPKEVHRGGARGISADGRVIIGDNIFPSKGSRAFRWTKNGGMETLRGVKNSTGSIPEDVSADGSVIVGTVFVSSDKPRYKGDQKLEAFLWTKDRGMMTLGGLKTASQNPKISYGGRTAYAVSADGKVVVGDANGRAFRWTQEGGMEDIVPPEKANVRSSARDVSGDGSVVVGSVGDQAFVWTKQRGMDIVGGGIAQGVSADGGVVVGDDSDANIGNVVFIWTPGTGTVLLSSYLESMGVDSSSWALTQITKVSDDGKTIVGVGTHNGVRTAFVVGRKFGKECSAPVVFD